KMTRLPPPTRICLNSCFPAPSPNPRHPILFPTCLYWKRMNHYPRIHIPSGPLSCRWIGLDYTSKTVHVSFTLCKTVECFFTLAKQLMVFFKHESINRKRVCGQNYNPILGKKKESKDQSQLRKLPLHQMIWMIVEVTRYPRRLIQAQTRNWNGMLLSDSEIWEWLESKARPFDPLSSKD